MEWIALWYVVGLVGAYIGVRRAMIRMGARYPGQFDDPGDHWREVRGTRSTRVMLLIEAILGPFSLPVILFATWTHERGLK